MVLRRTPPRLRMAAQRFETSGRGKFSLLNSVLSIHRFHLLHPIFDDRIALTPVKTFRYLAVIFLCVGIASAVAGPANIELQPSPTLADQNSHDIFSYETTYTFNSDFKESKLGDGDSLYDDFSYDHRFLITGKWYLRLGV